MTNKYYINCNNGGDGSLKWISRMKSSHKYVHIFSCHSFSCIFAQDVENWINLFLENIFFLKTEFHQRIFVMYIKMTSDTPIHGEHTRYIIFFISFNVSFTFFLWLPFVVHCTSLLLSYSTRHVLISRVVLYA